MAFITFNSNHSFGPRPGLEGPYTYPNGRVLYYDPKQGEYWDPRTDFYIDREEVGNLQNQIFNLISK